MIWRSTKLGEADRHCLALLHPDFDELRERRRRIYGIGTAAHDIHDRAQQATNAAGKELDFLTVEELARRAIEVGAEAGRKFEGEIEPPLRPGAYLDGKELALDWLDKYPCQPGRESEIAVTIDAWGVQVAADSPKAWMRGILDVLWIEEDGILIPADLKTDWPSKENALVSPQRKIQAILAFAWASDKRISGLRPEVWNLRTKVKYPRREDHERYTLDSESLGILDVWRQDLLALTRGYDKALAKAKHPEGLATPGAGCLAGEGFCPALRQCKAGQSWLDTHGIGDHRHAPTLVRQLAVTSGELNRLRSLLEPAAEDLGVIRAENTECGFEEKQTRRPIPEAALELWREWRGEIDPSMDAARALNRERDLLVTFLRAHRVTSKGAFEDIQKKLWKIEGTMEERRPIKQTRALQTARLTEPENYARWFVRKTQAAKEAEADAKLLADLEASVKLAKEKR